MERPFPAWVYECRSVYQQCLLCEQKVPGSEETYLGSMDKVPGDIVVDSVVSSCLDEPSYGFCRALKDASDT